MGPHRRIVIVGLLCAATAILTGVPQADAKPDHRTKGHKGHHHGKCTKKGTKGPDILRGSKHADVICGKGGDDVIYGFGGKDVLKGGAGNDILIGGDGADKIKGSVGSDAMSGGKGGDNLDGGRGSDSAAFSDAKGPVTIDLVAQTATGIGKDKLSSIENAVGSPYNDTLIGNGSANAFAAGSGNDMLTGGGGDDSFDGETGTDTVSYAASTGPITANLAAGTITGEGSDSASSIEILVGSPMADSLSGSPANDTISGGGGNDVLMGGAGDDVLNGQDGADQLYGEDANDSLHGDAGDDLIDGGAGVNACDGGTGVNTFAGNCDSGPPTLSAARVSPASVDTSSGGQTVQFEIDAADDLAGVDAATSQITVHTPSGATRSVALAQLTGNQSSGTFGADFTLSRYSAQGVYEFDVTLADNSGNSTTLDSAGLVADGQPGSFEQTGAGDSTAPVPTALTMTPSSVDTSGADRDLLFSVSATDDLSGVDASSSTISVVGPNGLERVSTDLTKVSGSDTDGGFTGEVTLPRYSAQGAYTLKLTLVDQAGNERTYESSELVDGGMTGGFDQLGAGDTAAPQLTAFSRDPATTDTREGSQGLTVTIGATDALSGLDLTRSKILIRDPNGRIDSTNSILPTGTNTFRATPTLVRGSAPGIWKIDVVLYDKAGNKTVLDSAALGQLGYQATFQNLGVSGS